MTDRDQPKRSRKLAGRQTGATKAADGPKRTAANAAGRSDRPRVPAAKPDSKVSQLIALLHRAQGATVEEMIAATGWQAHTTRAALTGLCKKGHIVAKTKRDGVTCYRIAEPACRQ